MKTAHPCIERAAAGRSHLYRAMPLVAAVLLAACEAKSPPDAQTATAKPPMTQRALTEGAPTAPASPTATPKSIALATLCSATAHVLKSAGGSDIPRSVLEDVDSSARQFAAQEASAKGLRISDVEQQTTAVIRLATKKVTPEDSSDQSARKVEAETKARALQIRTQCVPAFGRQQ